MQYQEILPVYSIIENNQVVSIVTSLTEAKQHSTYRLATVKELRNPYHFIECYSDDGTFMYEGRFQVQEGVFEGYHGYDFTPYGEDYVLDFRPVLDGFKTEAIKSYWISDDNEYEIVGSIKHTVLKEVKIIDKAGNVLDLKEGDLTNIPSYIVEKAKQIKADLDTCIQYQIEAMWDQLEQEQYELVH